MSEDRFRTTITVADADYVFKLPSNREMRAAQKRTAELMGEASDMFTRLFAERAGLLETLCVEPAKVDFDDWAFQDLEYAYNEVQRWLDSFRYGLDPAGRPLGRQGRDGLEVSVPEDLPLARS